MHRDFPLCLWFVLDASRGPNVKKPDKPESPLPEPFNRGRRVLLIGMLTSGALLSLKYVARDTDTALSGPADAYRAFEDVYRKKWTWDRVVRGTHGTNCMGNCAFNVYVKGGIVWREEQQG